MISRKVFVQMGQAKSAKTRKASHGMFRGNMHGKRPEELLSLAVEQTRKAAEGGDAQSQYLLGVAYLEGNGVRQNAKESFRWFSMAAEQGLADAQYQTAAFLHTGTGCTLDKAASAAMWLRASEQNHAPSMCCYGLARFRGDGVEQNKREGFEYLRNAAKLGEANAAALLRTPEMIAFAMEI